MKPLKSWGALAVIVVILGAFIFAGPELVHRFAYAIEKGHVEADRSQLAELSRQDQLSPLFRAVAGAVRPAVVEVRVTERIKVQVPEMPDFEDFFQRYFGEDEGAPMPSPRRPTPPRTREFYSRGLGSGVIVDAEKGYVITNYHVVGQADKVEVVLSDNRSFPAEWVRTDAQTDLAVVKIKPDHLIAAPLGEGDKVEVGDLVLAIGAPEGLPQTVTMGIISAKGRTQGDSKQYQNFIQTDAAINHGNSGGPLVNMRGEVIGINTAIVSRTGVSEGIGLAIPADMVKNVMRQLVDRGKVTRGYLGVGIQDVDEKLAKSFNLPNTKGALVSQVMPGGPADRAGIKAGDFIVAVNGKEVADVNQLRQAVADLEPGKTVPLEIYRDGRKKTLEAKVEPQPAEMAMGTTQAAPGEESQVQKFGLEVITMTKDLAQHHGYKPDVRGVMVKSVDPSSDAAEQGITEGIVITAVNGKPVTTAEEFAKAMSGKGAASGARLQILTPSGMERFIFITPTK